MRNFIIFLSVVVLGALGASARVTTVDSVRQNPGIAGGIYYAYPVAEGTALNWTAAPDGYKPFYVSHYGRHGSRYLISDEDYLKVVRLLEDADSKNALTPLGKELKAKIDTIYEEARGRGGELTPLGARQHRAIAHRLIETNPEIFEGDPLVTANSTVVMRCAHSMFAFCEGLKEVVPTLNIPRESGQRSMDYLNYHSAESNRHSGHEGDWYQLWRKFKNRKTNPERLVNTIFSDPEYVARRVNPEDFMWDLYWVTVDLQNMETPIRLYDLFTAEELYDLWQVFNFNFYACNSSYPAAKGTLTDNAKNLVNNILTTAESYIDDNRNGATLRFGHDGNIIPLVALLQLDDCFTYVSHPDNLASHYADYSISPMASNLQMIFYKSPDNPEILVRMMLNEREITIPAIKTVAPGSPYYTWTELSAWLRKVLDTPSADFINEQ